MNEPDKLLLRRKDVMTWTGISKWEFYQLIENKLLKPTKIGNNSKKYFWREEVRALFFKTQIK